MTIDEQKLQEFMGKMAGELGAAMTIPLVIIGDQLGFYTTLAEAGPLTSTELAERTGTAERYVREWLATQAAAGYVEYNPEEKKFFLSPEQALVFANEDSPVYMTGGMYTVSSMFADVAKLIDAFRSGQGVGWGEHHEHLFCGTAKFYRSSYLTNLVASWIPALEGVKDKLEKGAKVADVGCGHGFSTVIMAQAFPNSKFYGYDIHEPSIEKAREVAREAGVDNVTFEVASAKEYPGNGYDLVACFDCLHDMGDPAGASAHVLETLNDDGTWLIVEPFAFDEMEQNFNPVGRMYYAASTMICTPGSLSQEVGLGLGAQAGESRIRDVVTSGGFTRFRRAAESPFNIILEARP